MAKKEHYTDPLLEGRFYHIYNRSIAEGNLFKSVENKAFFLKKCLHFFGDRISLYAYCLLNNHFHLLIRVEETKNDIEVSEIEISGIFRRLFQSYALSFNSYYGRKGTLFQRPFKRALIETEQNFTNLIYYIHANPQRPGLINDFKQWNWSSYASMISEKPTSLCREEVLNWFGGKEQFIKFHSENQSEYLDQITIEDY
jgi:REP element-mobilizing transposase RayT